MRFSSPHRRRDDERGAVLILGAVFAAVAIVAAALSVDIGSLVLRKRTNQRVADLAALDGVRGLLAPSGKRAAVETLVLTSAAKNGFEVSNSRECLLSTDPEHPGAVRYASADRASWLLIEAGNWNPATATFSALQCIPGPANLDVGILGVNNADAVRVTASSPVAFDFMPGGGRETADATAIISSTPPTSVTTTTLPPSTSGTITTIWGEHAGVIIGSRMASIDTTKSDILNNLFNAALDPTGATTPTVAISAVGYTGLADTYVSLGDLATSLGLTAGTVDQVMNTEFTVQELFGATIEALDRNGDSTATVYVQQMYDNVPPGPSVPIDGPSQTVSLSDLSKAGIDGSTTVFDGSAIAASYLTVLDVLRAGALVADGNHLISMPFPASLTPAGVTTATIDITVIEGEKTAEGAEGTTAQTAQIQTTMNLTIPVTTDVGVANVVVPVNITGGGATAEIDVIDCPAPTTVPDTPAPPPATTQTPGFVDILGVANTLQASTGAFVTSVVPSALGVDLVTISADPVAAVTSPGSTGQTFKFLPDFTGTVTVQAASLESIGVPAGSITVDVAGILPVGVTPSAIAEQVSTELADVLSLFPTVVMPNLYDALGVGYGSADIRMMTGATMPPAPYCSPTTTSASTTTGGGGGGGSTTAGGIGVPTLVD